MPANEQNSIYILSRNNYDSFQDKGNNIFFVRENSPECGMSLYVGDASQSDLTVVDGSLTWTDGNNVEHTIWDKNTNLYDIPSSLQVQNKLFLIKKEINDETIYNSVIWNGTQFSDCGIPNNVILVNGANLPPVSDGIKDFFYILPTQHSIYVFDGTQYVSIISTDSFVTVEMLNEVAARIPIADELTILSRVNNGQTEFYGAGADLSGKMVIVGSDNPVEASPGATIFNNYDPTPVSGKQGYKYGTTAIGEYSSAFGTGNVARGNNSVAFGTGNTVAGGGSAVFGSNNTIGDKGTYSCVFGTSNNLNSPSTFVTGAGNTVAEAINGMNFISGCGNSCDNAVISFTAGFNNLMGTGALYTSILGEHNTIEYCDDSSTIGYYNTITNSNDDRPRPSPAGEDGAFDFGYTRKGCFALGTYNIVKSQIDMKETVHRYTVPYVHYSSTFDYYGFSGIALGHGNNLSCYASNSIAIGGYCLVNQNSTSSSYTPQTLSNTINTPRSIVIGSGNALYPRGKTSEGTYDIYSHGNFVIGNSNTVNESSGGFDTCSKLHIFGDSNIVRNTNEIGDLRGTTYVFGQGNTVAPHGTHNDNSYIIGYNNKLGISGYSFGGNSMLIGHDLITQDESEHPGSSFSPTMIIGKFNTGKDHHDIVIASGIGSASKFDAITIDNSTICVNPDRVYFTNSFQGDMMTGHGTSLTLRTGTIQPMLSQTGIETVSSLPINNSITSVIWNNATGLQFTLDSELHKFKFPIYANSSSNYIAIDQTTDYSCLLVIPKLASFTTASDILVNFTANDASRVYLLNPDIDITDYTVLHVLLFYDLTNLCAIVSGYEEVTTP